MMSVIDYAMDHDRAEEAAQTIAARLVRQTSPHASPVPAMSFETNERLEYTDIRVTDPRALLAPVEHRLGRYMGDVLHSDAMEHYLKTLHKVKAGGRGRHHRRRYNGVQWRLAIIMPSPDRIVTTITDEAP